LESPDFKAKKYTNVRKYGTIPYESEYILEAENVETSDVQPRVTFYTKAGCHLCDMAREILDEVAAHVAYELTEIDIRSDSALFEEYRYRIPVILVNGQGVAEGRVEYDDVARALHIEPYS
jgi:glutaredoxin